MSRQIPYIISLARKINDHGNITNIPNVRASFRNNFYNQSFTIGFTYAFGKQLNKEQRKTSGADIEAGRVGN